MSNSHIPIPLKKKYIRYIAQHVVERSHKYPHKSSMAQIKEESVCDISGALDGQKGKQCWHHTSTFSMFLDM
jgi:hypothetical protein